MRYQSSNDRDFIEVLLLQCTKTLFRWAAYSRQVVVSSMSTNRASRDGVVFRYHRSFSAVYLNHVSQEHLSHRDGRLRLPALLLETWQMRRGGCRMRETSKKCGPLTSFSGRKGHPRRG